MFLVVLVEMPAAATDREKTVCYRGGCTLCCLCIPHKFWPACDIEMFMKQFCLCTSSSTTFFLVFQRFFFSGLVKTSDKKAKEWMAAVCKKLVVAIIHLQWLFVWRWFCVVRPSGTAVVAHTDHYRRPCALASFVIKLSQMKTWRPRANTLLVHSDCPGWREKMQTKKQT